MVTCDVFYILYDWQNKSHIARGGGPDGVGGMAILAFFSSGIAGFVFFFGGMARFQLLAGCDISDFFWRDGGMAGFFLAGLIQNKS